MEQNNNTQEQEDIRVAAQLFAIWIDGCGPTVKMAFGSMGSDHERMALVRAIAETRRSARSVEEKEDTIEASRLGLGPPGSQ